MHILKKVKSGQVQLAFRKWNKPTVKESGTLKTPIGVLRIDHLTAIQEQNISDEDLRKAGYDNRFELMQELTKSSGAQLYKIAFHLEGPDPRIQLRNNDNLTKLEIQQIKTILDKFAASDRYPNWSYRVIDAIYQNPGKSAGWLSETLQIDKTWLKMNIRKLKEMGLTISLEAGYRISPRGQTFLQSEK